MAKLTKIAAAAFAVAAIVLLGYAIFSQESDEDVVTPGMGDRQVYSSSDLALIVVSSFIIAVAIMFIFLREEYEPLPPSMKPYLPPPPPKDEKGPAVLQDAGPVAEKTVPEQPPREADDEEKKRETYLVLRLLTGDERTMFRTILDSGGEALQKDLMQRAKMSNAKVSRVLDRLVEKGVVSKERHGSTNKVRIVFDFE
ncbi:MAG: MarR family transcriptional regulator [Thermoplasmata archaeon]